MPSIQAGTSVLTLTDHFCAILAEHMPARLLEYSDDVRETYQLTPPSQYIEAPTDPVQAFKLLNVDAVAGWVVAEGPSSYLRLESGSLEQAKADQSTRVRVAVIAREPSGLQLPQLRGRQLLISEWSRRRAEYYKAALLDVICQHGENVDVATQVLPVANDAAAVTVESLGTTSQAGVIFECWQDVLIRRKQWS